MARRACRPSFLWSSDAGRGGGCGGGTPRAVRVLPRAAVRCWPLSREFCPSLGVWWCFSCLSFFPFLRLVFVPLFLLVLGVVCLVLLWRLFRRRCLLLSVSVLLSFVGLVGLFVPFVVLLCLRRFVWLSWLCPVGCSLLVRLPVVLVWLWRLFRGLGSFPRGCVLGLAACFVVASVPRCARVLRGGCSLCPFRLLVALVVVVFGLCLLVVLRCWLRCPRGGLSVLVVFSRRLVPFVRGCGVCCLPLRVAACGCSWALVGRGALVAVGGVLVVVVRLSLLVGGGGLPPFLLFPLLPVPLCGFVPRWLVSVLSLLRRLLSFLSLSLFRRGSVLRLVAPRCWRAFSVLAVCPLPPLPLRPFVVLLPGLSLLPLRCRFGLRPLGLCLPCLPLFLCPLPLRWALCCLCLRLPSCRLWRPGVVLCLCCFPRFRGLCAPACCGLWRVFLVRAGLPALLVVLLSVSLLCPSSWRGCALSVSVPLPRLSLVLVLGVRLPCVFSFVGVALSFLPPLSGCLALCRLVVWRLSFLLCRPACLGCPFGLVVFLVLLRCGLRCPCVFSVSSLRCFRPLGAELWGLSPLFYAHLDTDANQREPNHT